MKSAPRTPLPRFARNVHPSTPGFRAAQVPWHLRFQWSVAPYLFLLFIVVSGVGLFLPGGTVWVLLVLTLACRLSRFGQTVAVRLTPAMLLGVCVLLLVVFQFLAGGAIRPYILLRLVQGMVLLFVTAEIVAHTPLRLLAWTVVIGAMAGLFIELAWYRDMLRIPGTGGEEQFAGWDVSGGCTEHFRVFGSASGDRNRFAVDHSIWCAFGVFVALRERAAKRAVAVSVVMCCVAGIVFSLSRTGILCLVFFAMVQILRGSRAKAAVALVIPLAVLLIGMSPDVLPGVLRTRLTASEQYNSFFDRIYLGSSALDVWSKSPVLGANMFLLADLTGTGSSAHSTYIDFLAGTGLVGACLMCAFLISAVKREWGFILQGRRCLYQEVQQEDTLALAIMVILLLASLSVQTYLAPSFWVGFGVLSGLGVGVVRNPPSLPAAPWMRQRSPLPRSAPIPCEGQV